MSVITSGIISSQGSKEDVNNLVDPKYSSYPPTVTDRSSPIVVSIDSNEEASRRLKK